MPTEAEMIKNVDSQIRRFIGGSDLNIAETFKDSAQYRRMADKFWNKEIVGQAKSA